MLDSLTPPGLDIRKVDINVGWPCSGNLITDGPMDLRGGSDTILEFAVGPNTTSQNRLVR